MASANGPSGGDVPGEIAAIQRKLREMERDLYGDPRRPDQQSIFSDIRELDEKVNDLRTTYERRLEEMSVAQRINSIYLKGVIAILSPIFVALAIAAIFGMVQYLSGAL